MEIRLEVMYDEMSPDGSRSADSLRREIFKRYPNAIWEKYGSGHRILV